MARKPAAARVGHLMAPRVGNLRKAVAEHHRQARALLADRHALVWIERQLAAVIRPAHRTVGAKGKGPPESPPTALFGFGSPGRTRTSDQSVTPVPPFPTGVDYLIAVGRTACRRRALVGRLFFRHSLVSAPSLRPAFSEGAASGYHIPRAVHFGLPDFPCFSLTGSHERL